MYRDNDPVKRLNATSTSKVTYAGARAEVPAYVGHSAMSQRQHRRELEARLRSAEPVGTSCAATARRRAAGGAAAWCRGL